VLVSERILVVDDHHAWREQICSLLRTAYRERIVDEADDGLTAVQKAEALEPDLVMLDVTLPAFSGIEAARQIIARNPQQKILFVSLHQALEIVQAALATGARGYLVKSDSGSVVSAVEAVAAGKCYLSAVLTGRDRCGPRAHEIGFYADDARLLAEYACVGAAALQSGRAFIFCGNASRRHQLRRALQSAADTERAIADGRYIELDVDELIATLLVDGRIDEERFWTDGTSLFLRAASAAKATRGGAVACGDATATLFGNGNMEASLRLEQLWDEWARHYNVDVFCGYLQNGHGDDPHAGALRQICAAHSAVRP
jgi:CheY-like chemotaxis protein